MSSIFVLMSTCALLAAIAAGAELLARLWSRRQGYFVHRRWERTRMVLGESAGLSLESTVIFEVNGDGERGDPLPHNRDGLYRVLVAGGSAVECGLLDQTSAWPSVVQRILNHRDALNALGARRVHVGNVGRSLTPVSVIKQILKSTLPRYEKLDLVILMVGGSDAIEWMELKTPARLRETPTDSGRGFRENPLERFGWGLRRLALRRLAGQYWRRYRRPVCIREDFSRKLLELRQARQQASQLIGAFPDPSPMLDHLEHNLRQTVAVARAKGARVVIVRQHWLDKILTPEEEALMWNFRRGRIFGDGKEDDAYFTHDAVRDLLWKVDRRIARAAEALGVEQVDLSAALTPSLENFYDFIHFTPAGARRVADVVAAAVLNPCLVGDLGRLGLAVGVKTANISDTRTGIMVKPA